MAVSADVAKPLRVLVSEGSSPSAREAVTILGLSGHHVEVCDPNRYCLARFSRFVRKLHHCPGLRDDPAGFLRFIEQLLAAGHFDVLLPIHEQGFLFARVRQRLERRAGLALPHFAELPRRARQGRLQPAARPIALAAAGHADRCLGNRTPRRDPVSCGRQNLGGHREPRCLVRAQRRRARRRVARARRERGVRRRGRGAGLCRGRDRKGAGGVLPRRLDRVSWLSPDRRRRRRRRGDQRECEPSRAACGDGGDRRATRLARCAVGRLHLA